MNPGRRGLDVGNEDRIRRQQHRAQARGIADIHFGIARAHRDRGLDQTDIGNRGGDHEFFIRKLRHQRSGQDDDIRRHAIT